VPAEDAEMTRMVRREISRRYVDATNVDVKVMHGVCYLRGYIKQLRGHDNDLNEELEVILRILRQKPGIREVICELGVGGPGLRDYVRASNRARGL
jgi:osmotically-inducible protein OsmY